MSKRIEESAVESGTIGEDKYFIVPGPMGGLNGYVLFSKRPVKEPGYDGIISYVPVHGGVTYANEYESGMMYGFDTGHHNSSKFPIYDHGWIKRQCEVMADGIRRAAEVENKYLKCTTNKGKAKHADYVREADPDAEMGFGAMINLISGSL